MGQKIKHRQVRKPRNHMVKEMILNNHGGPMKDKRDRRSDESKNNTRDYLEEYYSYDD